MEQAVDVLQALLDFLTETQLHLQVWSMVIHVHRALLQVWSMVIHVHRALLQVWSMVIHVHTALLNIKKEGKKGTEEKDQKGNPPNHHTVQGLKHRASAA